LKAHILEEENNLKTLISDFETQKILESEQRHELELLVFEIAKFGLSELQVAKDKRDQALNKRYKVESDLSTNENRKKDLSQRLDEIKERIDLSQEKIERMEKIRKTVEILGAIRDAYRSIQPKLRCEFVKVLRNFVQQVLDSLVCGETPMLNVIIDETYTPYVKSETGIDREVSNLSGENAHCLHLRTVLAWDN
jgi:DNA repair exonuclease SbcCD ATPase subunit